MRTDGEGWVLVKCRDCGGSGRNSQARDGRCTSCEGKGTVLELKQKR